MRHLNSQRLNAWLTLWMWSYVTVNAASPEWLRSQGCVPLLFVLFRLVENEMTDDAAPHLADMIQANTGLTHLWWGQHSISLHPVYTAWIGALTQLSVLCKSLLVGLQVNQQPVHCGRDQAARWGPRSQQSTQRDMVSISSNWHLGLLFSPQGYVRPSRGWVIIWSPTYSGHKLKLVRDWSVTVRLLNALLSLPTWTKTGN